MAKRIHCSCNLWIDFHREYEQGIQTGLKPVGIWYSFGNAWVNFCTHNLYDRTYNYRHELQVDTSRILKIETFDQAERFNVEYQLEPYLMSIVDWKKVADKYDGIEIENYFSIRSELFNCSGAIFLTWLYGWDVPSGCIWNLRSIQSIQTTPHETAQTNGEDG